MVSAWALILLCGTVIGALKPIPQRSAATFFAEGNDPLREWLRHLKFSVLALASVAGSLYTTGRLRGLTFSRAASVRR